MKSLQITATCILLSSAPFATALATRQSDENPATSSGDIDLPQNADYRRRVRHSIAVLGKRLYIEGGSLERNIGGSSALQPFTVTASFPLDKSWTNATLRSDFKSIAKNGNPGVGGAQLWADEEASKLYSWGGTEKNYTINQLSNRTLWTLKADNQGGGSWAKGASRSENDPSFLDLFRNIGGAGTVCNGSAYLLGGYTAQEMDDRIKVPGWFPTPGLVTYNMDSGYWSNETVPLSPYSMSRDGSAQCLPYGEKGLVLFLGGDYSADPSNALAVLPNSAVGTAIDRVAIYDPKRKAWHEQNTTGDAPTRRRNFCNVGAKGLDGSYEIIVYGGTEEGSGTLNDISVLTIPGFHWTKAAAKSPRSHHKCAVAGGRQMIVVGGQHRGSDNVDSAQDPWPQGVGVLDMTDLVWRSSFEPNLPAYQSPDAVRKWYADGGQAKVKWSNDTLKALFSIDNKANATSPSPSAPSPSAPSEGGGPPIGAIVGGTLGGLALISIIVFLLLCLRKRRATRSHNHELSGAGMPELGAGYKDKDAFALNQKGAELSPYSKPAELPTQRSEGYGMPHYQYPDEPSELSATLIDDGISEPARRDNMRPDSHTYNARAVGHDV